jgi:hypothetical protein
MSLAHLLAGHRRAGLTHTELTWTPALSTQTQKDAILTLLLRFGAVTGTNANGNHGRRQGLGCGRRLDAHDVVGRYGIAATVGFAGHPLLSRWMG